MMMPVRSILMTLVLTMAGNSSLAVPPAEKLLAPDTVAFVTAPNGEALAAALRRNPYG